MLGRFPDRVRVCGLAGTGRDAVRLVADEAPDVTLLDLHMPEMDGVAVLEALRDRRVPHRAVMLTAFDDLASITRALRAGAVGYLLKTSTAEQLARAVEGAARDDLPLSPAVVRRLAERPEPRAEVAVALTPREQDVLAQLATGLTNRQIAAALCIEESTVKQYLGTLQGKLQVSNRTALVVAAARRGLLDWGRPW
jgi:DNA-binding NarL/FixJ family response regulator